MSRYIDFRRPRRMLLIVLAFVVALVGLPMAWSSFSAADGGYTVVVRNGGPFDNRDIRGVIPEGSARQYIGVFSKKHPYPTSERYYSMVADPARADSAGGGVILVRVPTSDGVEVTLEGSLYFTLNPKKEVLESFDQKYGTRTYRYGPANDQKQLHAWEGNEGWSAFLDAIVQPVIISNVRQQIGDFRCVDIQASCALVQNAVLKPEDAKKVAEQATSGKLNNETLRKVQEAVVSSVSDDFRQTLGGDYLTNIRFTLGGVNLPSDLQKDIVAAQGAFAKISTSQANLNSAKLDADANTERQRGYANCPACAQIDVMKAIPPNVTTYAPGANTSIPLK